MSFELPRKQPDPSFTRCHREILKAREKLTNALDPSIAPAARRGPEQVIAAVHDLEAQIAGKIEQLLLSSLRVSQRRIIEMNEIAPLKLLLETGLEQRKKTLSANLEAIRWDISSPSTLRAVIGSHDVENVGWPWNVA